MPSKERGFRGLDRSTQEVGRLDLGPQIMQKTRSGTISLFSDADTPYLRPVADGFPKKRKIPSYFHQICGNEHRSSTGFADQELETKNPKYASQSPDLGNITSKRGNDEITRTTTAEARNVLSEGRKPFLDGSHQVTKTCFQIFIKTPESKSFLVWVHAYSTVMQLKQQIWALSGYPRQIQHLVNGRWSLQDNKTMGSYGINPGVTIVLNFRLRGGAPFQGQTSSSEGEKGKNTASHHQPKGGISYKNILQGNKESGSSPDQGRYTPKPYIVDQLGQTPTLNFDSTGLDVFVNSYETQALICRFNSFWPKPMDLFHWIFTTWTMECDIHLCSKGFFIVRFASSEARETIISKGPWF